MPRPKRADVANGIYHALNRGIAKTVMLKKYADPDAFERIVADELMCFPCRILAYQQMSNHWHVVLQTSEDGAMSNFLRWVTLTHTQRTMPITEHRDRDTLIKDGLKVFPLETTITFSSSLATLNETLCEQIWLIEPTFSCLATGTFWMHMRLME